MVVNIYFKPSCINRLQMQPQHGTRCHLALPPPVPARRLLLEQCPVNPESGSALPRTTSPPLLHPSRPFFTFLKPAATWAGRGSSAPPRCGAPGELGSARLPEELTWKRNRSSEWVKQLRRTGRDAAPRRGRSGRRGQGARSPGPHRQGSSGTARHWVSYNSCEGCLASGSAAAYVLLMSLWIVL